MEDYYDRRRWERKVQEAEKKGWNDAIKHIARLLSKTKYGTEVEIIFEKLYK